MDQKYQAIDMKFDMCFKNIKNMQFNNLIFKICGCMDSICNDPKRILGSYVKGPNNIICRAWVFKN